MKTSSELYRKFRSEIDGYAAPLIVETLTVVPIFCDGTQVGFLSMDGSHIDGLFVKKEHRRKGLGKKAVLGWIKENGLPNTLCIINNNLPAQAFWNKLFHLKPIEWNTVDTLYSIVELKGDDDSARQRNV